MNPDEISYSLFLPDVGRYLILDDLDAFSGGCYEECGNLKFLTEAHARWAGMTYQNSFEVLGVKVPKLHILVHEGGLAQYSIVLNG